MNVCTFDFETHLTTRGFILGLSFSVDTGSIALRTPDGHVHCVILEGHRSHSSDSLEQIRLLMQTAGVSPSDCVAVAADIGPGGFTGLRTACGLVQGLAVGWDVPCIARSSLELLAFEQAHTLWSSRSGNGWYVSALDARQNEVYAAQYELRGNLWFCIQAPQLLPYGSRLSDLIESCVATDQHSIPPVVVQAVCGAGIPHLLIDAEPQSSDASAVPGARALVELAAFDAQHQNWVAAAQCQPLYVREQMALTTAQRKARLNV